MRKINGFAAGCFVAVFLAGLAWAPIAQAMPVDPTRTVATVVVVDGAQAGDDLDWFMTVLQDFSSRFPAESNNLELAFRLMVPGLTGQGTPTFVEVPLAAGGEWGNIQNLLDEIDVLPGTGSADVDGFVGIQLALGLVPDGFKGQNVIMLTTGARSVWDPNAVQAALDGIESRADSYVNAIIDHGYGSLGQPLAGAALGARNDTTTYHPTPGGGVDPIGAGVDLSDGGMGSEYATFIKGEQAGSGWDVSLGSSLDPETAASFSKGFTDVKIAEYSGASAPPRPGPGPEVPEPATAVLFVIAGGALVLLRQRRK